MGPSPVGIRPLTSIHLAYIIPPVYRNAHQIGSRFKQTRPACPDAGSNVSIRRGACACALYVCCSSLVQAVFVCCCRGEIVLVYTGPGWMQKPRPSRLGLCQAMAIDYRLRYHQDKTHIPYPSRGRSPKQKKGIDFFFFLCSLSCPVPSSAP